MISDKLTEKSKYLILLAVSGAFFLLYLSLCFNENIWTDEAFTIELIKGNIGEIIEGTASDVHPPLYYLILKPFTVVFGDSLLVMKIVSIIPMVLTMAGGSLWLCKREGFFTGLLFILFLGAIPCTMEYAVQIRMYSWAIFFVTALSVFSCEMYRTKSYLMAALAGMMGAFAALTHYFAFAAALWIYGFLFLVIVFKKREVFTRFLTAVCISLILFSPWYPDMYIQVSGVSRNYWIQEITEETWAGFLPFLFGMDIPYGEYIWAGVIIIAVLCIIFIKPRGSLTIFAFLCLLVPVATLLTGVEISALMRPIFIIRYLLPCMGLLAMFLGISFGAIKDRYVQAGLVIFCVAALCVDTKVSIYREYQWTHTRETLDFIAANVGENDVIAYNYEDYDFVYDYYWDDDEKVAWSEVDLEDNEWENIWLFDTIYMPFPTNEYLDGYGWAKDYYGNYGIEHNNFKIWRLHRK